MKDTMLRLIPFFLFSALSIAHGATIPPMVVTVTNAGGKVVYEGKTGANGAFATGNLEPGNYVVQFTSKKTPEKGAKFALSAVAGKNNVSSDSVAGERFTDPGVAMKIALAANSKITGQVAPAGMQTQPMASGKGKAKVDGPVKIINGKRYIWVRPQTSSLDGGQWVEENEAAAAQGSTRVLQSPQQPKTSGMRY